MAQSVLYSKRILEIRQAEDYWNECDKMHYSPEGRKALRLFKEFLSEGQREELDRDGEVRVMITDDWGLRPMALRKGDLQLSFGEVYAPGTIFEMLFRFEPRFTIHAHLGGQNMYSVCWHPEEVIPPGDIALIHLLEASEDPNKYVSQVNY